MVHSISIPIYPEADTHVAQLFNYIQHQSQYTILEIISDYRVKRLFLEDRVYHGICYIAVPELIYSQITDTSKTKKETDILDLSHFIIPVFSIIENRNKKGDITLSTWMNQINKNEKHNNSIIQSQENLCINTIALLNILGTIIIDNNKQEMKQLGIKRGLSKLIKF